MKTFSKATDVQSHEDACQVLGKDPSKKRSAIQKLINISNAMKKIAKFRADFNDPEQEKWYAYFLIDKNGLGFSCSYCGDRHSFTLAGARLGFFFPTQEDANHFGSLFIELHREVFFGKKKQVKSAMPSVIDSAMTEIKDVQARLAEKIEECLKQIAQINIKHEKV